MLVALSLAACSSPKAADSSPSTEADADTDADGDADVDLDSAVDTADPTTELPSLLASTYVQPVVGSCTLLAEVSGAAGDHLGATLVAIGDADADGSTDLAVLLGDRAVATMHTDGATFGSVLASNTTVITGLEAAGDLDGDGVAELFLRFRTIFAPSTADADWGELHDGVTLDTRVATSDETFGMVVVGDQGTDGQPDVAILTEEGLSYVDGVDGGALGGFPLGGYLVLEAFPPDLAVADADHVAVIALDGTPRWEVPLAAGARLLGSADLVVGDLRASPNGVVTALNDGVARWADAYLYGDPDLDEGTSGLGYGSALASAGDWNGDGVDEVVAGGDHRSGEVTGFGGTVRVLDGSTGAALVELREIPATGNGRRFGSSVASVPDLDGDGLPELVAGVADAPPGGGFAVLACRP